MGLHTLRRGLTAILAALLSVGVHAEKLDEIRLDYAFYSPESLVIKHNGWLEEAFADQPFPMEAAGDWLAGAHQPDQAGHQDLALALADGRQLLARHMGASGLGESMVLLSHEAPQAPAARRLQQVALTPRETEVLSWLSKGKTNRDIADILGMSPRTVNKHLEHIFEKLGVETRTAAAAVAGQLLQAGSP